jgi:hypothetical protein
MYTPTTTALLTVMTVAIYAYAALCFQRIARGHNLPHTWYSWIPVLNVYLVCRIIGKRYLWTVLCFVPVVNFFLYIVICFKLSRACGKGRVLGLLLLIPGVDLVVLWILVVHTEDRMAENAGMAPGTDVALDALEDGADGAR